MSSYLCASHRIPSLSPNTRLLLRFLQDICGVAFCILQVYFSQIVASSSPEKESKAAFIQRPPHYVSFAWLQKRNQCSATCRTSSIGSKTGNTTVLTFLSPPATVPPYYTDIEPALWLPLLPASRTTTRTMPPSIIVPCSYLLYKMSEKSEQSHLLQTVSSPCRRRDFLPVLTVALPPQMHKSNIRCKRSHFSSVKINQINTKTQQMNQPDDTFGPEGRKM